MKRIFKWLFAILISLALLLVVAAVALPMLFDAEDLRRTIETRGSKATGRDVRIAGDLEFSIFPWIAVDVSQISLGNPPEFGNDPFASVEKARIGVALLPLLRRELIADEIRLDGLRLDLQVNAQGLNNWEDHAGAEDPGPAAEPSAFGTPEIAGVDLRNAQISYRDDRSGSHWVVSDLALQSGHLGGGKSFDLSVRGRLEDRVASHAILLDARARLTPDPENGRVLGEQLAVVAESDDGATRTRIEGARLEADLDTRRLAIMQLIAALDLGPQSTSIPLEVSRLDADLEAQSLSLERFTARFADADIEGTLTARDIQSEYPTATGHLRIPTFVPRDLLVALGTEVPETADPAVLGSGSLEADFEGSLKNVLLSNLNLVLDDSHIEGRLGLPDVESGAVRFDLDIDAIDLDRYLPPTEATEVATAGTPALLPRDELRGWNAEGTLRAARLRLLDMDLEGAILGVSVRDNVARLKPVQAQLFGGRYTGDITLDASGEVLEVKAEHQLESMNVQAIGERFGGINQLSGTVAADAATYGRGNSSEALLRGMSGSLDLNLADGVLDGVNVWREIYAGYALYRGRPGPPPAPERTEISSLKIGGPIRDGVIETRELSGDVQGVLRLSGRGTIRLSDQQLDLGLTAQVRNVPTVTEDPVVASLAGQRLPLRITGPMASPSVSVDFAELLRAEATDKLLEKLGGSRQRDPDEPVSGKDQLRDAATELLRGLLNKETTPPKEEDGQEDGG